MPPHIVARDVFFEAQTLVFALVQLRWDHYEVGINGPDIRHVRLQLQYDGPNGPVDVDETLTVREAIAFFPQASLPVRLRYQLTVSTAGSNARGSATLIGPQGPIATAQFPA